MIQRLNQPQLQDDDDVSQLSLRPESLATFIGQDSVRRNARVFIDAAKSRGESLDHVLLHGPPGLGKTTFAQIIARELGVGFRATSGPILHKGGDIAAILTNLQSGDVLFVGEIHRLPISVEEILYPAMEDFKLDLLIGEGPSARSVRIDLPRFTLVGATTRIGLLSSPLRDRFGIPLRLGFYNHSELEKVLIRAAQILNTTIQTDGVQAIAKRARGTPRIALRLLKRVRDFASAQKKQSIDAQLADTALALLEVDQLGLDSADHRYLNFIATHYDGGPVGVETIAAGLSEQRDTLEETIEPYLLQIGFLQRTPKGRLLTAGCRHYLGMPPQRAQENREDAVGADE